MSMTSTTNTNNKHLKILMLLISIGISFILYFNTIKGSFVYDDQFFNREELQSQSALSKVWFESYLPEHPQAGVYRPVTIFSFALDFIIFGNSPVSFRVINIILNGIVVFLVFLLVLRLFNNKRLAILSSLFFAFLPIHTEVVAFIKSRDEIFFALFITLSWLIFIKATENKVNYRQLILSSIFYFLGLLSKEMVIIAPVLFILVYRIQKKASLKQTLKISLTFLFTAIAYFGMRYLALGKYAFGSSDDYFVTNPLAYASLWIKVWTPLKIAFIYISKTFVPINLSAAYQFNQVTLVSNPFHSAQAIFGLLLLGVLLFCVLQRKIRVMPIGIGALIFLVSYFMISKFFFQASDIVAERWMYFPSIGISIIAAYLLDEVYESQKLLGIIIFAIILIVYSTIIIPRNRVWLSETNLYESMIKSAPDSIQGYLALTTVYFNAGKIDDAKREIVIASNIYKDDPRVLDSIGAIAIKERNYDLAESSLIKALQIKPDINQRLLSLSKEYYDNKNYKKALETTEIYTKLSGHKLEPNRVWVYALTLARLGFFQRSLDIISQYSLTENIQFLPLIAENYYRLGYREKAFQYLGNNLTEEQKTKILESF